MRRRPTPRTRLTRAGGFALAGVGMFALAILIAALRLGEHQPLGRPAPPSISAPLQAELDRCRQTDRPGVVDDACRAAWRGLRQRFFGVPEGARP